VRYQAFTALCYCGPVLGMMAMGRSIADITVR